METDNTPKVFISYSWDNEEHKKWVLNLADELTRKGVLVFFDRYDLYPGKDLTHFMETSVSEASKVLLVLTTNYKLKAEKREGGVGSEYSMMTAEIFNNQQSDKFIPILRSGDRTNSTPSFVKTKIDIDMSDDSKFDESFEELLRTIYNEPEIKRPEIGEKPKFTTSVKQKRIEQEDEQKRQQQERDRIIQMFEMIVVQGGTFTMGGTEEQGDDCFDREKPIHTITVSDFCIGKFEVTQAQWKAVMGTDIRQQRDKANPSWPLYGEGDNYPMYYVNWDDAQEFISRLNTATGKQYRLLSEAEWEYAARGGAKSQKFKYSGSNSLKDVAWYSENSGSKTHPVGSKQANELGIHDMSGNVWEWCSDWYAPYTSGAKTNPTGPPNGTRRVVRGGGWSGNAEYCRVSGRSNSRPAYRSYYIGFRLACSL